MTGEKRRAIVHRVPDLDAVASVAAAGVEPHNVLLLPTSADEVPPEWSDALVLDHPLGRPRAQRVPGRSTLSTLASMPAAEGWDPRVVEAVERSVRGGEPQPDLTLQEVLDAARTALIDDGYSGRGLDVEVLRVVGLVVRGLAQNYQAKLETERAVDELVPVSLHGFRLAVLPPGRRLYRVAEALAERGIALSVYQSDRGLGVTRHDGFHAPDLRALAKELPGWFIHEGGFLACWGSSKAPVSGPPPAGTPQTQAELVQVVRKVFGDWHCRWRFPGDMHDDGCPGGHHGSSLRLDRRSDAERRASR